jgi:hypothetical protein
MSVRREIAERLIIHANQTAVDLLFPYVREINSVPRNVPEKEQLLQRWNTLPVNSAVNLISAINDQDILDCIALKDKRKTVRIMLAKNKNLHPVTRMYFYQLSLSENDYDLRAAVEYGIKPEELLFYLFDESNKLNNKRIDSIFQSILIDKNLDIIKKYHDFLPKEVFNKLVNGLINFDPEPALKLLEDAAIDISDFDIKINLHRYANMCFETYKKLYKIDKEGCKNILFYIYKDEPEKIIEIDSELLSDLLDERYFELPLIKLIIKNNKLLELFEKNPKFSQEAINYIIENTNDRYILSRVIMHSELNDSILSKVNDYKNFINVNYKFERLSKLISWISDASEFLVISDIVILIDALSEADVKNEFEFNPRLIEDLASKYSLKKDDFLLLFKDITFTKIKNYPKFDSYDRIIDRVKAINESEFLKLAHTILRSDEKVSKQIVNEIIELTIKNKDYDLFFAWVSKAEREDGIYFVLKYKELVANEILKNRNSDSDIWLDYVIDIIKPKTGWGSIRNSSITLSSIKYLEAHLGNQIAKWEMVLCLYETWTGTLSELVSAVEQL